MIRYAENSDKNAVFDIWKQCFGDDDSYINFYLNGLFSSENCIVKVSDGAIAAMLTLMPMDYSHQGENQKTQYIYAAATLPAYRRVGFMGELIEYAVAAGKEKGLYFTSLLPASEQLYHYYQKNGFKTAFYLKKIRVARQELERLTHGIKADYELNAHNDFLFELRRKNFKSGALWGREMMNYILDEWRYTGGEILTFKSGYALCKRLEDAVFVKEVCADKGALGELSAALLDQFLHQTYLFHLPQDSMLFSEGEIIKCGMLRLHDQSDGSYDEIIDQKLYSNMMLD